MKRSGFDGIRVCALHPILLICQKCRFCFPIFGISQIGKPHWKSETSRKTQNRPKPTAFDAPRPADSKMGSWILRAQKAKKLERFEIFAGRPRSLAKPYRWNFPFTFGTSLSDLFCCAFFEKSSNIDGISESRLFM